MTPYDSGWQRREDTRTDGPAHGITFIMHERWGHNIRAEVAVNERKLHSLGRVSLTLAWNQYRYGNELIAQLFTNGPVEVLDRRADGWTRVQIFFGQADLQTAQTLEAIAAEIRQRLLAPSR
jgi:hypothetical protein